VAAPVFKSTLANCGIVPGSGRESVTVNSLPSGLIAIASQDGWL
jgi:hypothetical protein